MPRVVLYDTTLRDGTQRAGISLSLEDKVQIALALDEFGMDYVEGGYPGSNVKDSQFFAAMQGRMTKSRLVAFGSTARKGRAAEEDPNLQALIGSGCQAVTIFGKASVFHAERVLEVDPKDNLQMVQQSVRFLADHGLEVIFDAEHFFDGAKADSGAYAFDVVRAAEQGGARWIVLCDTNGGSLPHEVAELTERAVRAVSVPIGIHAHNDAGLGVANSLTAVTAGAQMVHGTINGYGERCGNADLCVVLPNLVLKMGYEAGKSGRLEYLTRLSRTVADIANQVPDGSQPYVGENAFTHKAGMHVGAVRKHPEAYEHVVPAVVGQKRKVLVSELAGRSNLLYQFDGVDIASDTLNAVMDDVKRLEAAGYQFEAAESSVALMVQRAMGTLRPYYQIERFHVSVAMDTVPVTEATVRLIVDGQPVLEVGDGDGPVNALDNALRKALTRFYPVLAELRLTDYKVRVLDGKEATAATVRVHVRSEFRGEPVTTVGVSPNILEASWKALLDAVDYTLWKAESTPAAGSQPTPSTDMGNFQVKL